MASDSSLLEDLANTWSRANGRRLIDASAAELTEDLPPALLAAAASLREQGDAGGDDEYTDWASRSRAHMTRRAVLARPPNDQAELDQLLAEFADRFDDALFELWFETVQTGIGHADATDAVRTTLTIIRLIAAVARRGDRAAEAQLYEGTHWLLLAQQDPANGALRSSAVACLRQCAEDEAAAPEVRARAENNLAVLAAPARAAMAAHQLRAQQLAEQGSDPDLLRRLRRGRAAAAREDGDLDQALALLRANLDAGDREIWRTSSPVAVRRIVEDMLPDLRTAIEICLERGRADPVWFERALEFAEREKARPFLRAAAVVGGRHGPVPARLQRRRALLQEQLRRIGAGLRVIAELDPGAEARAGEIRDALGDVEADIESASRVAWALDAQWRPLEFAEMVAQVPLDAAVLSFYVMPERTLVFALTGSGLAGPPVIAELPESKIIEAAVLLQQAITSRADYATFDAVQAKLDMELAFFWPDQYLRFLFDQLIAPVVDRLGGVSHLWINAHARLLGVPFHAVAGSDGVPLNERWAIAYAPGIAVLARSRRAGRVRRETMFAAGTDAGGPQLRGTRDEARAVAAIWRTSPHPATLEAVQDAAVDADIVHLGCHSNRLNAVTAFQGLQLEDGMLNSLQIAATPFAASLVTLSACETSGGDTRPKVGDELAGIVGAFLRAGVPSVIATFWPLADQMAAPLMTAFYSELCQPGTSPAQALARAARTVRSAGDPAYQHPYFWAPFCIWGDGASSL